MRRYKTSKRGLTFSITPDEQYHPGSHYVYEVRKNCIIIRPSEEGMTVSTCPDFYDCVSSLLVTENLTGGTPE